MIVQKTDRFFTADSQIKKNKVKLITQIHEQHKKQYYVFFKKSDYASYLRQALPKNH